MLTHVTLAATATAGLQTAVKVLTSPSLSTRGRVPHLFAARHTASATAAVATAGTTAAAGVAASTDNEV
eukprot:8348-Heterococcus_DN1.PRE.1